MDSCRVPTLLLGLFVILSFGQRTSPASTPWRNPVQNSLSGTHDRNGAATARQMLADEGAQLYASNTSASNASCTSSSLGYTCMIAVEPSVTIHYTLGGSVPPDNTCTASTTAPNAPSADRVPAADQQQLMHLAIEMTVSGWLGLSFPLIPGRMSPADAVIGLERSAGIPDVNSYHLTSHVVDLSDVTHGWALNLGFISTAGRKVLCFSRALESPAAVVVKSINPNAPVALNWAYSSVNSLTEHDMAGSLELNLASGKLTVGASADSASQTSYRIAHGALMLAAFVALMPAAVLMARHKWLFGDDETGLIGPGWFKLHQVANSAAVLLVLTATVLIFVRFKWEGRAETASYYTGHRAVGMTAIAMMLVQVLLGLLRPRLGTLRRPMWRRLHQYWGWLTLLLGTAATYMGIALIHDLSSIPLAYWLGPALAVTGLLILVAIVLEARKLKLERLGRYSKTSHTVAPALPAGIKQATAA